jgi:hypothetical protein
VDQEPCRNVGLKLLWPSKAANFAGQKMPKWCFLLGKICRLQTYIAIIAIPNNFRIKWDPSLRWGDVLIFKDISQYKQRHASVGWHPIFFFSLWKLSGTIIADLLFIGLSFWNIFFSGASAYERKWIRNPVCFSAL